MGQPINVVEKPSSNPGLARFETNRSLTGMGHERYRSVDDILAARPVDELARRLFESGGVTEVHANGSMVTVHLAEGWTGAQLLDVIRGLYIFYPPAAANGDAAEPESAAVEPQAEAEPAEPEPAAVEPRRRPRPSRRRRPPRASRRPTSRPRPRSTRPRRPPRT